MKHLRVTVQGKSYDVTVEMLDEAGQSSAPGSDPGPVVTGSAPVDAVVSSASASSSTGAPGDILSPLAGKVVAVQVSPGKTVKEGDEVVTLEAMKMNTYIYAPSAGTIAEVLVKVGDAVAEG